MKRARLGLALLLTLHLGYSPLRAGADLFDDARRTGLETGLQAPSTTPQRAGASSGGVCGAMDVMRWLHQAVREHQREARWSERRKR